MRIRRIQLPTETTREPSHVNEKQQSSFGCHRVRGMYAVIVHKIGSFVRVYISTRKMLAVICGHAASCFKSQRGRVGVMRRCNESADKAFSVVTLRVDSLAHPTANTRQAQGDEGLG